MTKRGTLMLVVALTGGCTLAKPDTAGVGWIAVGDRIQLQQPVRFPANESRVYLQGGGVASARAVTVWEPVCSLQLDHAFPDGMNLPPQQLDVASVQRRADDGRWERGVISYVTHIRFTKEAMPLRALECEVWAFGYDPSWHIDEAAFDRATRGVLLRERATPR